MGPKARAPQARTKPIEGRADRADPSRPPDNPPMGSRASSRSAEVMPRHHATASMETTQGVSAPRNSAKGSKDPRLTVETPPVPRMVPYETNLESGSYVNVPPMFTESATAGSNHPSPFEQVKRPAVDKGKERQVELESTRHSRRESEQRSTTSEYVDREYDRFLVQTYSQNIASHLHSSLGAERYSEDPIPSKDKIASMVEEHMAYALSQMVRKNPPRERRAQDDVIDQSMRNLGAPRGASERSSDYGRRTAAAARQRHTSIDEPREIVPPPEKVKQPRATTASRKRERTFADRVAIQRERDGDLQHDGTTNYVDQGIGFDQNGYPYDKEDPANMPGPFKAPSEQDLESRSQQNRRLPDSDDNGGSDSSSSEGSRNRSRSDRSRRSRRSERPLADRSKSRQREEQPPPERRKRSKSPTSRDRRHRSRSKHRKKEERRKSSPDDHNKDHHHQTTRWSSYNASQPKSSYVQNVHEKYRRMIDEQVEVPLRLGASTIKTGTTRLPTPDSYSGEEDIEKFDAWLQGLLRWLKLNLCAGPELERERIAITGLFLKDKASIWFNDNVEGVLRQQRVWSFHGVITSLYDRFIHEATIQDATSKYNDLQFKADNGVMGFYYDLERYSKRMVQAPDPYSFRTRFVFGLPRSISNEVLAKGFTAEKSSLNDLVTTARDVEEAMKVQKRYDARRNLMAKAAPMVPKIPIPTTTSRLSYPRVTRHPVVKSRTPVVSRPSAFPERSQRPPEKTPGPTFKSPPPVTRPVVTTMQKPPFDKGGRPGASSSVPPGVKCYNCGGPHYANACPQGNPPKPRMAALHEQDEPAEDKTSLENQEEDPQTSQDEAPNDAQDSVEEVQEYLEQYEEPLVGSQYSSPGEEYPLELYEQFSEGEFDEVEQMFKLSEFPRTISSDAWSDHIVDQTNAWAEDDSPLLDDDDPEVVVEFRSITDRVSKDNPAPKKVMVRMSSFPKARPYRHSSVTRPLVGQMNINGLTAVVMFDSGSTADAVSPDFARVANMKIFALEEPVPLLLGCKGSRSKIVYGTQGHAQFPGIDNEHYFDVINIDRYDAIIGIGFMRTFGIKLDPETDTIIVRGVSVPALLEGEEAKALAQRHSLRRVKPAGH